MAELPAGAALCELRGIESLEVMLARDTDNALLRYALGRACLKTRRDEEGLCYLGRAVAHDPGYSAAWKTYRRALADAGRAEEAIEAHQRSIEAAESKGDIQAAKEMRVFRRRLERGR